MSAQDVTGSFCEGACFFFLFLRVQLCFQVVKFALFVETRPLCRLSELTLNTFDAQNILAGVIPAIDFEMVLAANFQRILL